jgi:hypothetical protein
MPQSVSVPTAVVLGSMPTHFLPWRDARKVYLGVRVFNQKYGLVMNVHAVFHYGALGITDPAEATALLSAFNQVAARWVRRKAIEWGQPLWEPGYVYVHEHSRDRGLHTHQLMFAPGIGGLHRKFNEWAQAWLRQRMGAAYDKDALRLVRRHFKDEFQQVERQWRWVSYILKSVEETWVTDDGLRRPILDFLHIGPDIRRPTWPIACAQRTGISHNLGAKKALNLGFPAFAVGPCAELIRHGWDLDEYRRRVTEQIARGEVTAAPGQTFNFGRFGPNFGFEVP